MMDIFLKAIGCKNEGRAPIWLMRQAGRYLPEYRKLKEGRSLFEMFHNPSTVVEATLLPIERLGVDAAILFSDILTVLEGLNIRYDFYEGIGPMVLDPPSAIKLVDSQEVYGHIQESIHLLRRELKVPLIGFAGAPFTIASYLIEGKTSRDLRKTKQWLFRNPESFKGLLDKITEATIAYLDIQIDAGVEVIQLFDSWANALPVAEFRAFALNSIKKIVESVKKRGVPIILFCRGSCLFAKELVSLAPSAISLDWSGDLPELRKHIPTSIAVQGNLDPMALYGPQDRLREKVDCLLNQMSHDKGYIFNLGHGLLPDTPIDNVLFLVDYVREYSCTHIKI
jgi:uroporphyrinogen decarboxylase